MDRNGPNKEQIDFWNDVAGPHWVEAKHDLDSLIGPLGQAALLKARPEPGEAVLDVGCGTGQTTLLLAKAVGPAGRVLGVDISAPMLESARAEAKAQGLGNVSFQQADAQTQDLSAANAALLFSRFGVMFFSDPVAAFANLRSALGSGGRLAFICWQSLPQNPWMQLPLGAAAQHLELPDPPAPGSPGPMSLADPDPLRSILKRGGFESIELDNQLQKVVLAAGGTIDQAVEHMLSVGPVGGIIRAADQATQQAIRGTLRESLEPFVTPTGVQMDSACWLVTARRA